MPSHYLNLWWNIVNLILRNKLQWNVNRKSYIFIQENRFENVVGEIGAILSRPQCVKGGYQIFHAAVLPWRVIIKVGLCPSVLHFVFMRNQLHHFWYVISATEKHHCSNTQEFKTTSRHTQHTCKCRMIPIIPNSPLKSLIRTEPWPQRLTNKKCLVQKDKS